MTDFTFTLLRLGFLVLLWVFVLSAIGVLRRDLYGTKVDSHRKRGESAKPAVSAPASTPTPVASRSGGSRSSGTPRPASSPTPMHAPGAHEPAVATPVHTPAVEPVRAGAAAAAGHPAAGHAAAGEAVGVSAAAGPVRVGRAQRSAAAGGSAHSALPESTLRERPGRRSSSTSPTKLVVTEGNLRGTTVPLSGSQIVIGRAPGCSLVLDDDYSSSRHARIFSRAGGWYLEDLGSTNGTFINEQRITDITPLALGTRVRIGQSVVELQG